MTRLCTGQAECLPHLFSQTEDLSHLAHQTEDLSHLAHQTEELPHQATQASSLSWWGRRFRLPFFLLLALTACGYHVTGRGDLIPQSVKTIAIPAFANGTPRYQLARLLPSDITREFITKTRYKVIEDPNQADAVLRGTLVNFGNYPTIFDPASGRATGVQVVVTVQVVLTERATGKTIFSRPNMEVRERYQISTDPQTYFDESGTAMIRVSKDVAQSIVSAILENF